VCSSDLERPGGERPSGTAACSRHGRGHTPRRWRRVGCTDDRSSGGGAGPRRRSARGGLRLDNEPEPWHNSCDRLGLSELETVTRVRLWRNRALTPRLSPLLRYPNAVPTASAGAVDAAAPQGRKERAPRELGNREERCFPQRPQPSLFPLHQDPRNRCQSRARRQVSRIRQVSMTADTRDAGFTARAGRPRLELAPDAVAVVERDAEFIARAGRSVARDNARDRRGPGARRRLHRPRRKAPARTRARGGCGP